MNTRRFSNKDEDYKEDHSLDGLSEPDRPVFRRYVLHKLFHSKVNPIMGMETLFRQMDNLDFQTEGEAKDFIQSFTNKPIDESLPDSDDPKENANRMVYEAFNSSPQKGQKLIKKALNLDLDNADAYNYLAIHSNSVEEALHLFEKATQVGRKALTEKTFRKLKGEFWGVTKTRPYMRAKAGMAECFYLMGKEDLAIKHYKEMIELNPNDNQGVRDILAPLLVKARRFREYEELKKKFPEDIGTHLLYTHACYLYIRERYIKQR